MLFVTLISISSNLFAQLPDPGFEIDGRTAIVITDPQNDFLSPDGVTWGVVGESVTENNTVENLETMFELAEENGIPVFVSPHYYYEHDHKWKFEGALEVLMPFYKIEGDIFPGLLNKMGSSQERARYIGNTTNHFIPKNLRFNWMEIIATLQNDIEKNFL